MKLIYLDPPFLTGDQFTMRVRVGEREWRRGTGSLVLPSYADKQSREEYQAMMRRVLEGVRELLRPDGMLFLHCDFRANPILRTIADELFGWENFLNEIIWVYHTGGTAKRYFSRKHDVILFYRKGPQYDFHIESVLHPRVTPRDNHMRKHVDPDGRVYRSIRSGGRVYTYYDDDPVPPTDVWDDVSHLQQRDPQRTGYDTQKPLALLDRIVRCASREGEMVIDPFAGSGTTLEAAKPLGRALRGRGHVSAGAQHPAPPARRCEVGIALRERYGSRRAKWMAAWGFIISLSAIFPGLAPMRRQLGRGLSGEEMRVMAQATRTKRHPEMPRWMCRYSKAIPGLRVCDVRGKSYYYKIAIEDLTTSRYNNRIKLWRVAHGKDHIPHRRLQGLRPLRQGLSTGFDRAFRAHQQEGIQRGLLPVDPVRGLRPVLRDVSGLCDSCGKVG